MQSISGGEPHESWGGWENFLNSLEIKDQFQGVIYYTSNNSNYIFFPDGTILENYSSNGVSLMKSIRELGVDAVLLKVKEAQCDLRCLLVLGYRLHDAQYKLNPKHPIAFPRY